jgi:2-phosphosulfolactate phosphatase
MCVAFKNGVEKILPLASPEECLMFKDFDFIVAAEKDAVKIPGFDLGNSPFEFQNPLLEGKNIAFSTTNGTKAIKLSREQGASQITIGSFLNIQALCDWLKVQNQNIVLLCSGWKNKINIEDTVFAGAVIDLLAHSFAAECDSSLIASALYQQNKNNLEHFVRQSNHAKRFELKNLDTDDISFCLQQNTAPILAILKDNYLVKI